MSGSSNMFGNDPTDYTTAGGGSVQTLIDATTGINSGWSFDIPKTPDTATTNAIQSMAPVQASGSSSGSDYADFWRGLNGSIVGVTNAVAAIRNGTVQPVSTTPVPVAPPNPNRGLLLVALAVGAVLLFTHKG